MGAVAVPKEGVTSEGSSVTLGAPKTCGKRDAICSARATKARGTARGGEGEAWTSKGEEGAVQPGIISENGTVVPESCKRTWIHAWRPALFMGQHSDDTPQSPSPMFIFFIFVPSPRGRACAALRHGGGRPY